MGTAPTGGEIAAGIAAARARYASRPEHTSRAIPPGDETEETENR